MGCWLLRLEVDLHAARHAAAVIQVAFGNADQVAVDGGPATVGVGLALIGFVFWHGCEVSGDCYLSPAMRNRN